MGTVGEDDREGRLGSWVQEMGWGSGVGGGGSLDVMFLAI